ncbi:hypothetical protein [Gimesia sp.]|uniref:hypothetical protein n=1 Tax=Gimesia sp. TaxID=2024833 RepID=UPI003A8F9C7B
MITRSRMIVLPAILAGFAIYPFITSVPEQSSEITPKALPESYSRDVVQYYPDEAQGQFADQRQILEAYKIERSRKSAQSAPQ